MKPRLISFALACFMLTGSFLSNACALNALDMSNKVIQQAGFQALQTATDKNNNYKKSKQISFDSLEYIIRNNNQSIKSFEKTLESIKTVDVSQQFVNQRIQCLTQSQFLQKQLEGYKNSESELRQVAGETEDSPTKKALEAQANAMKILAEQTQASIYANDAMLEGFKDSERDAIHDLDEKYTSTRKQLENASDQIVIGAQTQYITLITLENTINSLNRTINAIQRTMKVIDKQFEIGLASEIDVKQIKNQYETAKSNLESLKVQKTALESNLAVILGNDLDTIVNVKSLKYITDSQINAINYNSDLQNVMKNSYNLWQKKDAVRKAKNDYAKDITSTKHALEASQIDLEQAEKQKEMDFKSLYDLMLEKQRLIYKAQSDFELAKQNFEIVKVKLDKGMISQMEYETEKDKLDDMQDKIESAKIELFTTYNQYKWTVRGAI